MQGQIFRIEMPGCARTREIGIIFKHAIQSMDNKADAYSIGIDDTVQTVRFSLSMFSSIAAYPR